MQLSDRDREKREAQSVRQKLEEELDGLRKVMAEKSSEDVRRREADKSREAEMNRLRDQVASAEKAMEDQKRAQTEAINALRVKVEGLAGQHKATEKELRAAQATLVEKTQEAARLRTQIEALEEKQRTGNKELLLVKEQREATDKELRATLTARDVSSIRGQYADDQSLDKQLQSLQDRYNDLEDAVLLIEEEKTEWAHKLENTARQLMDESSSRQQFEQAYHEVQAELANERNARSTMEREHAKFQSELKACHAEIALLRSRENKTIVEHVHVLEQAKKMTDRQLAEQVKENHRLNTICKTWEGKCHRLQYDLDDSNRERDMLKKEKGKTARAARASLSPEDKDVQTQLEDERKARKLAESRVAALERDLQDQRRELSTKTLSAANAQAAESKLQKKQEEIWRLEAAREDLMEDNERLQAELNGLRRRPPPSTPRIEGSRAELLRGLQQSHDALGKDMSDQLRRLDAQPLTPSRRENSAPDERDGATPLDILSGKRTRALETELQGLRRQFEDEREEKEVLLQRVKDLEGHSNGTRRLPTDSATMSQLRLKVKSLGTQLDQ